MQCITQTAKSIRLWVIGPAVRTRRGVLHFLLWRRACVPWPPAEYGVGQNGIGWDMRHGRAHAHAHALPAIDNFDGQFHMQILGSTCINYL